MIEALKNIEKDAQNEIADLTDPKILQDLKIKYLGRKGLFASLSARISEVTPEERRAAGQETRRAT